MINEKQSSKSRIIFIFLMSLSTGVLILLFLHHRSATMSNSLLQASREGKYQEVLNLLNNGANPNAHYTTSFYSRIFEFIKDEPHSAPTDATAIIEAAGRGHANIVKLLITRGANVNTRCIYYGQHTETMQVVRFSALEVAKRENQIEAVKILTEAGAN